MPIKTVVIYLPPCLQRRGVAGVCVWRLTVLCILAKPNQVTASALFHHTDMHPKKAQKKKFVVLPGQLQVAFNCQHAMT